MRSSAREVLRQHGIPYIENARNGKYSTNCPSCGDGYLNVCIESNRVAWYCHACQHGGGESLEHRKSNGGGGAASALGPIKASYDYRDERGARLFQVLRFEPLQRPKQFRQRIGPDQEKWSIEGVRRVLFQLPELVAEIGEGRVIVVVEGEKDVLTLRGHNIPATTKPMGAVSKQIQSQGKGWLPEYSESLRGADLVLCGDNDAPGREHVRIISGCLHGVAKRLRVLDLASIWPDIKEGDDISDWFKHRGGTAEAFWAAVEQLPHYILPPEMDGAPAQMSSEGKPLSEAEAALVELNADNCLVLDGGKAWVLRFEQVHHNLNGGRYSYRVPTYLRTGDFKTLYMNRRVDIGEQRVELGTWWLRHPARRQYLGVVFEPGLASLVGDKLNLWTGWGVEPKRGDWSLMREHIFQVLAARDEAVDLYIINWLAWAVQHPGQQAETALVFLGKRGTGRGSLGNAMCRIFGNHALHISSPHHLTGRFNAHLRQCAFLFVDEAYAVSDKSAEGQLKALISEPTISIEAKGRDVITAPNHLHAMMASNADWVVPAGEIERRFVVQEVADHHAQDSAWFEPLYAQLQAGGLEAMLFDLLDRDLGNWHPRQIVRTAALARQQAQSLSAFDAWWSELLHSGYLPAGDSEGHVISGEYRVEMSRGFLTDNAKRAWSEKRKGLYEQARTSSPGLKSVTDAAFGRYLGKNGRGCVSKRVCRQRGWQFPTLDQCRKEWLGRFPGTLWDEPEATTWQGERNDDEN